MQGRIDFMPSRSPQAHRAVTFHRSRHAPPRFPQPCEGKEKRHGVNPVDRYRAGRAIAAGAA